MQITLTSEEIRTLGCLMEKSLATPDYYPLSLNALTNACNQKSNRDPVVSYDEAMVEEVLDKLVQKGLVLRDRVGRVPKYEENLTRENSLVPRETAALSVLMLRGPQTPGAIRSRTTRLCTFEDLDTLLQTLENLSGYGFVEQLSRLPGHKESRYTHLFSDEADETCETMVTPSGAQPAAEPSRMEKLEGEVETLKNEFADLKAAFEAFRNQF